MSTVAKSTRSTVITLASDSAGPFDLDFRLFDTDAVLVFVNYIKVDPGDYTLAATFTSGYSDDATITFDTAQSNGDRIEILSALTPDRATDYQDGPGLTALQNIELARIWSVLQDHARDISRSVRTFGASDPGNISTGSVPEKTDTGWRDGPSTADITNAAPNAAAAAQSAAEAAASAAAAATYDPLVHPRKDQNLNDLADIPTAVQNLGLDNAVDGTPAADGRVAIWNSGALDDSLNIPDNDDLSLQSGGIAIRSNVAANIKFSKEYVSTDQAMVQAGLLTLAHGLGAAPKLIVLEAVCVTPQEGYLAGDIIPLSSIYSRARNTVDERTFGVTIDATNIYIRNGNSADFLNTIDKNTGNNASLTRANWNLRVKGWA